MFRAWATVCAIFLAGYHCVRAAADLSNAIQPVQSTGSYIVEFESAEGVATDGAGFFDAFRSRNKNWRITKQWESDIFSGATVRLDNPRDLADLEELPRVMALRPVLYIPPPKPVEWKPAAAIDSQTPLPPSPHLMTGVDKLHARNLTGLGIQVAVIDTGVDYTHPLLGGGYGPGFKIAGGHDFVGDKYNGTGDAKPDKDPQDCSGHGTHVTGILAADPSPQRRIAGVAYNATVYMYRVFGCDGGTEEDVIIDAMIRAFRDGADVLSLSIGSVGGWTQSTSGILASRIADRGKIVTISAGNEGEVGGFYSSTPSSGVNVISVASVENLGIPLVNATTSDPERPTIGYFSSIPIPINETLPIYVLSTNISVPDDACAPLPANTTDLSKYVVLIRRGSCSMYDKLLNVAKKGGKQILIYNNDELPTVLGLYDFPTAAMMVKEDGEYLVKQIASGENITLSFPQDVPSADYPTQFGGLVDPWSTYGPTTDLYFKPSIAAPGGSIYSLVPEGGYLIASGTSMAAPFVHSPHKVAWYS